MTDGNAHPRVPRNDVAVPHQLAYPSAEIGHRQLPETTSVTSNSWRTSETRLTVARRGTQPNEDPRRVPDYVPSSANMS
jgi:hypothetical protein